MLIQYQLIAILMGTQIILSQIQNFYNQIISFAGGRRPPAANHEPIPANSLYSLLTEN